MHLGCRFYDPELGRFIQPDPLLGNPYNPQSLNRYAYCLNSPLAWVDPSGLSLWGAIVDWIRGHARAVSAGVAAAAVTVGAHCLYYYMQKKTEEKARDSKPIVDQHRTQPSHPGLMAPGAGRDTGAGQGGGKGNGDSTKPIEVPSGMPGTTDDHLDDMLRDVFRPGN